MKGGMSMKELHLWRERMEGRKDLKSILHNKQLSVSFLLKDTNERVLLELNDSSISIREGNSTAGILIIEAPSSILEAVWAGESRLLRVPPQLVHIEGSFRNQLLLESIFHLAG